MAAFVSLVCMASAHIYLVDMPHPQVQNEDLDWPLTKETRHKVTAQIVYLRCPIVLHVTP